MKVQYIPTDLIRTPAGRIRTDFGDIKELADSIKRLGQIQPSVVARRPPEGGNTEYYDIIAGERRLRAAKLAEVDLLCVFKEDLDEVEMRELEIEENLKRKQFTPAEECEAIRSLHMMKLKKHGQGKSGAMEKTGWSVEDTAKLLGQSRSTVSEKIDIAGLVDKFPQLKEQKKLKDLKKVAKGLTKLGERMRATEKLAEQEASQSDVTHYELKQMDAIAFMELQEYGSIDILLTDPPYGIQISKVQQGVGGTVGGDNLTGFSYEDGFANAIDLYIKLGKSSYEAVKPDGHAFVFFAPQLYEIVKRSFNKAGWLTNHRPIIWIKNSSGQTTQPTMWPGNCYEMCFYFRKKDSRLVQEGKPDWIQEPPVKANDKRHPSQKPVALLENLLQRVCLPGQTMIDPFMGSGSSLIAGRRQKLFVKGSDISAECIAMAQSELTYFEKEKK